MEGGGRGRLFGAQHFSAFHPLRTAGSLDSRATGKLRAVRVLCGLSVRALCVCAPPLARVRVQDLFHVPRFRAREAVF